MPHPTEIAGTLLTHGRGKQDRARRGHASAGECFPERHQRREAARIVGDARSFETWPAPRHGDVQLGPKDGVEVGRKDHARVVEGRSLLRPSVDVPSPHVSHFIHVHVLQSDFAEHFRHARAACCLRTRGCRDGRQRCLAGERRLVRALDVRSGGADPLIGEKRGNHGAKL